MPAAKPAPKQMFGFSTTRPTNVYTPTPSKSPVVSKVVPRSTTTAPTTSSPKTVGGYSASFQNAYNALNPSRPTPTPVARPAPPPAAKPTPTPVAAPKPVPAPAPAPSPAVSEEDDPMYWYNILKGYGMKKGGAVNVKATSRIRTTQQGKKNSKW